MSKSNPDSAIFMEDTPEEVERKINQAFCPNSADESAPMQVIQICSFW
jgi:tyrosyl-tRNA synthetase